MIIGLSGPQRAGKTTVANILVENHGARFMSIGDQLKNHAHGLIGRVFYESEKDVPQDSLNGKTPRELYIHVGQIDEYKSNLWVEKMFYNQHLNDGKLYVIESVGKPIQWTAVKTYCANNEIPCILFDVSRPGAEYKDNRRGIGDPSWTVQIHNVGEVDDLRNQINMALQSFRQVKDKFIPRRKM